ncbi:hypothetical protein K461DRAFT_221170 [Myriangium duriaei CBS 260.36]|uniref:Acyltransferase 3 domain-containing protein n=1 Tax=Myriangium duriaei CBS 260.36 TaxID=1168546 RepID=A0A9P4MKP0_9PEZI|nr:hypothetical protein K461DRAFT_221170 [Myriangium duriaei CBS 260.36]
MITNSVINSRQADRRSLISRLFGWSPSPPNVTIRETAWLDGLRGLAAFLVMANHYNFEWLSMAADAPFGATILEDKKLDDVWHYQKGDRLWEPWRLPIARLFICSGASMVTVFFVLSGFVLSWGPLQNIRSGRYDKFARSLGSTTFRRWARLYLPCLIVSGLYLLHKIIMDYSGIGSVFAEIWNYIKVGQRWANPLNIDRIAPIASGNPYNFVMWTIPFEFSGSLFVFITLLAVGRSPNHHRRLLIVAGLSVYALLSAYWGFWLFGSGLFLADYVSHAGGFLALSQKTSGRGRLIWTMVFILGLVLLGLPSGGGWYSWAGYQWIRKIPLPQQIQSRDHVIDRFWWGCGAILTIAGACHLTPVRHFFQLPIFRYLGRISFMLYLIHFVVDVDYSQPIRHTLYALLCTKEYNKIHQSDVYITSFLQTIYIPLLLWVITAPVTLILANWLEVHIDRPCTNFAKWLDNEFVKGAQSARHTLHEEQLPLCTNDDRLEMSEGSRRHET